jgi:hypothetical protein
LARAPVSKSACSALYFKDHSEKSTKSDLFSINGLDTDSECAEVEQFVWDEGAQVQSNSLLS